MRRFASRRNRGLAAPVVRIALGFTLLSLLSGAFDAPDLFSRGGISATLRFAAPILLAGLGALWAERSGVINLGLEGMMIAGTWFGAWAGYQWGIGPALVAGTAVTAVRIVLLIAAGIVLWSIRRFRSSSSRLPVVSAAARA